MAFTLLAKNEDFYDNCLISNPSIFFSWKRILMCAINNPLLDYRGWNESTKTVRASLTSFSTKPSDDRTGWSRNTYPEMRTTWYWRSTGWTHTTGSTSSNCKQGMKTVMDQGVKYTRLTLGKEVSRILSTQEARLISRFRCSIRF